MDWKFLLFSPNGRIGRKSFWIGFAIATGASFVSEVIPVIGWLLGIVAFAASICVYGKRLHDLGRTAWLQAAPIVMTGILVGIGAFLGATNAGSNDPAAIDSSPYVIGMMALAILVWIGFTIWLGATPGQPERNEYGRAPDATPEQDAAETFS
jgi:uncharacterized membrane protein YhaH (DUF805 family)